MTTLAKFPVMKKISSNDRGCIEKTRRTLYIYEYSSVQKELKMRFVDLDSGERYGAEYKPFFEIMYNLYNGKTSLCSPGGTCL